jgi:hypothetical protein
MKAKDILFAVILAFVIIWLAVLTAWFFGERRFAEVYPTPVAEVRSIPTPPPATVVINKAEAISDTVKISFKVSCPATIDLLFEPPILSDGTHSYKPTTTSLGEAKFALLDLVTKGEATATLEFQGVTSLTGSISLIFNPNQREGDPISPKVVVPVPTIEKKQEKKK